MTFHGYVQLDVICQLLVTLLSAHDIQDHLKTFHRDCVKNSETLWRHTGRVTDLGSGQSGHPPYEAQDYSCQLKAMEVIDTTFFAFC